MQLITIGQQVFNLEALTFATYDVIPTDEGLNVMGCTLSFGCDDVLSFYGEQALQAWEMIEAQSINLTKLSKVREAIAE